MFVFQPAPEKSFVQVIDDVVEITVGNEIVTDLIDPITINFYHNIIEVSVLVLCIFVPNFSLEITYTNTHMRLHVHIWMRICVWEQLCLCFF